MKTKLPSVLICILCMNITLSHVNAQQIPQTKTNSAQGQQKKLSDSEKKARDAKRQQERRATLVKEYGLSMPQVLQIESIYKQHRAKISYIRKSSLSVDTKKNQVNMAVDAYRGRIKLLFTPSQYAKYEATILESAKKFEKRREIIKSYNNEYAKIKRQDIPREQKTQALNTLNKQCVVSLSSIMKPNMAKSEVTKLQNTRKLQSGDIKILNLPQEQKMEMGRLKRNYETRLANLNTEKLPAKEKKERKNNIQKFYQLKVKSLLGEAKYNQWVAYNNKSHERLYQKAFGFTQEQYAKYKDIENQYAIECMRINKSQLSPGEKAAKKEEKKEKKIASVKKILSQPQFEKWHNRYLLARQKSNLK